MELADCFWDDSRPSTRVKCVAIKVRIPTDKVLNMAAYKRVLATRLGCKKWQV